MMSQRDEMGQSSNKPSFILSPHGQSFDNQSPDNHHSSYKSFDSKLNQLEGKVAFMSPQKGTNQLPNTRGGGAGGGGGGGPPTEKSTTNSVYNHTNDFDGLNSSNSNIRRSIQNITMTVKDWITHLITINEPNEMIEYFDTYVPQNQIFDIGKLKFSPLLQIQQYQNCIYYGIMKENSKEQLGLMCYFNGRLYEGQWENDNKQGKGVEIFPNGGKYQGMFLNGQKDGKGQFQWTNGEIYDGQWKGGFKHGSGMWRGPKGDNYIGQWKQGKADGFGVHTWLNGDRYEGEFKECLQHGLGTQRFSNGDVYVGNYDHGKPDGYGQYYWANGNFYQGYFVNGLRHGRGVWRSSKENGDVYDGEYRNDKKCGYGEYIWSSGNVFKGNFENDLRHGYGEMYQVDGSVYQGYWMNGIQVGEISNGKQDQGDENQGISNSSHNYTHLPTIEDQQRSRLRNKLNNLSISNPSQDQYLPQLGRRGGSMTNRLASAREQTLGGDQYSPNNHTGMKSRESSHLQLIKGSMSSQRRSISSKQTGSKPVWKPAGVAKRFDFIGCDLNAQNMLYKNDFY